MRAWRGSWGCSLDVPHPRSPGDAQALAGPAQSLTIHEDSNISVPISWRLRKLLLCSGHSPAEGILCQVRAEHEMINNFLIMYLVTNKAGFEHMNPFHQPILCAKARSHSWWFLWPKTEIWFDGLEENHQGTSKRNDNPSFETQHPSFETSAKDLPLNIHKAFHDIVKQHIPEKGRKPNGGGTSSLTPINCREWCRTGLRSCSTVTVNGPVLQTPSLPDCAANHF